MKSTVMCGTGTKFVQGFGNDDIKWNYVIVVVVHPDVPTLSETTSPPSLMS